MSFNRITFLGNYSQKSPRAIEGFPNWPNDNVKAKFFVCSNAVAFNSIRVLDLS